MPPSKLLILDANVVIYLHELHLWDILLSRQEVYLAHIVVQEVKYYRTPGADKIIRLSEETPQGRVNIFEQTPTQLKQFFDRFDRMYRESLDDGEAESLAYLFHSQEEYLICSGDAIVFRILGLLGRSEQGVSLEEVLQNVGLGRAVEKQFTKQFREKHTKQGEQDRVQNRGLRK